LKKLLLTLLIVFFIGCGYKPVSRYAKEEIQGLVYVNVKINIDSSSDTVLLKDEMNRLLISYLDTKLTSDKDAADTLVYLSLPHISHITLTSDQEGYVKKYRTKVTILVRYKKKDGPMKSFSVSDYSDYTVVDDAQLSDKKRDESVTDATNKALKKVFTKIALNNLKGQK